MQRNLLTVLVGRLLHYIIHTAFCQIVPPARTGGCFTAQRNSRGSDGILFLPFQLLDDAGTTPDNPGDSDEEHSEQSDSAADEDAVVQDGPRDDAQ